MRTIGYIVRRVVELSWLDEHNQSIRNECRRAYYWFGFGPIVRFRICRGQYHDMRYYGSTHAALIQFLQFILCVLFWLAAGLMVAHMITMAQMEDVSPIPRVGRVR